MPFDGPLPHKLFVLRSARDGLADAFAEIDRQAERAGIKRGTWVPDTWEGLADSMGEALKHRLKDEDR